MKKIYATVIYLFLLLSLLTGCNGKSQSAEKSEPGDNGQPQSAGESEPGSNGNPQSAGESEPESPYVTAVSEKQNFSTRHRKEYAFQDVLCPIVALKCLTTRISNLHTNYIKEAVCLYRQPPPFFYNQ